MSLFSLVGRVARTRSSSCHLHFHSSPAAAATSSATSSSSAATSFGPTAALVGRRARNLGQLSPSSSTAAHYFQQTAMSTAAAEPQRRVLSIQSHVVHGYVGNKSATFPLQVLGFEVDAINSVQFSNHTGYAHIKGQVLDDSQLNDLVTGLELNGLLDRYSHLLTGYVGKDAFLRKVVDTVRKLRAQNPHLVYVCDPVMGDDGHMYVPENLLPIYRDEIIPLADICTPNQFEAELLTGESIHSEADAWRAMQWFHERGVRTVALSSTDLGSASELRSFVSHLPGGKSSSTAAAAAAKPLRLTINIPTQGAGVRFTGTGDLFASLFLAHSTLQADDVKSAFERTVATLQSVIGNTVARIPPNLVKVESDHRELKIVQSKCDIETPRVVLKAVEVV